MQLRSRLRGLVAGVVASSALSLGSTAPPTWAVESDAGKETPAASPTGAGEELSLTLLDAIAHAIENNLNVEIERHEPLIAGEARDVALGAYDPELFANYGYGSSEIPVASSLQSANILGERGLEGGAGIRGLFPRLGGNWEIGYTGDSLETNSSIESLSPRYRASVAANVEVPLLRDLLVNEPWVEVELSGLQEESALDQFRAVLLEVVRDIEFNYWRLVASEQNLRVAEKSLDTAQALLELTAAQYEVGTVSKVEVTEARAGVAEREVNRIRADNTFRNAQDELIDRIFGPRLTPTSDLLIRPSDAPEVVDYAVDIEAITARAFERRPELAIARRAVDQEEIRVQFAKNQRLPELDVVGSYGYSGLAGRENSDRLFIPRDSDGDGNPDPQAPLLIDRRYGATDDDLFDASGARSWSLRANLSVPLGNVRARSLVRTRELELRQARTRLKRTEQEIILEARTAVRDLLSSREGIEAAERRRIAADEQLQAERVRLEYGESTPFDVLQRERDLVEAESQRIAALQLYREAIARLDTAQGTLLEDRKISIEAAQSLR
jgi:outer membrane protein TolC